MQWKDICGLAEVQDARGHRTSEGRKERLREAHHWTVRPPARVEGPLGLQVRKGQRDVSRAGHHFTRGINRLQNTSAQKSAALKLAGHGGRRQRCVERHQMACYETHFGQKIAGEFWFLGGQQSQRERGVGFEVAAQTAALVSDLGSILNSTPPHVLPRFLYL